jgi:hypothetical protein
VVNCFACLALRVLRMFEEVVGVAIRPSTRGFQ